MAPAEQLQECRLSSMAAGAHTVASQWQFALGKIPFGCVNSIAIEEGKCWVDADSALDWRYWYPIFRETDLKLAAPSGRLSHGLGEINKKPYRFLTRGFFQGTKFLRQTQAVLHHFWLCDLLQSMLENQDVEQVDTIYFHLQLPQSYIWKPLQRLFMRE